MTKAIKWPNLLSAIAGALLLLVFLNNPLWQDELYTLFHFVQKDFSVTALDYYAPNNHILFNLINNAWIRLIDVFARPDYLSHPWLLRIVPVSYTVLAVWLLYRGVKKHFSYAAAIIAVSIAITTYPFIGFGAQYRGYSLAILIATIQFFNYLRVLKGERTMANWISIAVLSGLSLLCLPTNLYLELSYLLVFSNCWAFPGIAKGLLGRTLQKGEGPLLVSAILAFGLPVLAFYKWRLAHYPSIALLEETHPFSPASLTQAAAVFYHFLGWRLYLPVIVLILAWKQRKAAILLPGLLFCLPFLFLFVSGALIIQRTFMVLIPFFVLMLSIPFQNIAPRQLWIMLALNLLVFTGQTAWLYREAGQDNLNENHQQDLVHQYYLFRFNPQAAYRKAVELQRATGDEIYLLDGFGGTGLEYYFDARHVSYHILNGGDSLPHPAIIVTNEKQRIEKSLRQAKQVLNAKDHYQIYRIP